MLNIIGFSPLRRVPGSNSFLVLFFSSSFSKARSQDYETWLFYFLLKFLFQIPENKYRDLFIFAEYKKILYGDIMNGLKNAIDLGWQRKGIYHFLNVMKFEINNFSDLSLNSNKSNIAPGRVSFVIIRDDNQYRFAIKINRNNIDTFIFDRSFRSLGVSSYNASKVTPQQIIEEGLVKINNDYSGEFKNGMV